MDKIPPSQKPTGVNQAQAQETGKGGSIHNETGGLRQAATGRKPENSLSAAKHPLLYIRVAITEIFSRVIDSAYSDIGKFARKTERTLENPFTSKEEKDAALDTLIKVLSKRNAADHREASEIDELIPDLIKIIHNKEDAARLQEAKKTFLTNWSKLPE